MNWLSAFSFDRSSKTSLPSGSMIAITSSHKLDSLFREKPGKTAFLSLKRTYWLLNIQQSA